MSSVVGRKRSQIWSISLFLLLIRKRAVCHECQENIAHGGDKTNSFNTSNLWKQLRIRHPDKLRELKEGEKEASKKKIYSCQRTNKFLASNA